MPIPAALLFLVILLLANPMGVLWGKQSRYEPGVLIDKDPVETVLNAGRTWDHKGKSVTAFREFEIDGRLLARQNYWFHEISPMDLVIGWGPTTDQNVVDALQVSVTNRTYSWNSVGMRTPLPSRVVSEHLRFLHVIAADESVQRRLEGFNISDLVRLRGFLVSVDNVADLKPPGQVLWVESAEAIEREE